MKGTRLFLLILCFLFLYGCKNTTTYTVNFNSMGGTTVESIFIQNGSTLTIPNTQKEGFIVEGWYTSSNNGETFEKKWSFIDDIVTSNITLYANWIPSAIEEILLVALEDSIEIGQTTQLLATVLPESNSNATLVYASNNPLIATVSETGLVTGVSVGNVVITATADNKTGLIVISVVSSEVSVTDVTITAEKTTIDIHEELVLTVAIEPQNATNKTVQYLSNAPSIATVSDDGIVTGISEGIAVIAATVGTKTGLIIITVVEGEIAVDELIVSIEKTALMVSETTQLTVQVLPEDATNQTVKYFSVYPWIATVSANGMITALQVGTTSIIVSVGEIGKSITITVVPHYIEVAEITLSSPKTELAAGETIQLTATVLPSNATNRFVTYASSAESIATVNQFGVVTALGIGTATITATAEDKTAQVTISVTTTRLIVATITEPSQNMWGSFWDNNETNEDVYRLTNGYTTVTYQRDIARFKVNPTVVKSLSTTDHDNGDKTYTIEINQDLLWNNGVPITAKDYVFNLLLSINPVLGRVVGKTLTADGIIQGSVDYADETKNEQGLAEFTGVKLIDDYTFSLRVLAEHLPYYYDFLYYKVSPLPLHHLLPDGDIVQGEVGVKITHSDFEEQLLLQVDTDGKGYRYDIEVTAGPYNFHEIDSVNSSITLMKNNLFKGNYEEQKPLFNELIIKYVPVANQMTALLNGEIDVTTSVSGGDDILNYLQYEEMNMIASTYFTRNGYGMIAFHSDDPAGPTASQAVRQAIALTLVRQLITDSHTLGFGMLTHGHYGMDQWMVAASADENGTLYGRDKDGILVQLNQYRFDSDLAIQLLEEDGWIWGNSAGTVLFDAAIHTVRYKTFTEGFWEGQTLPLEINWANASDNSISFLIRMIAISNAAEIGIIIKENMVDFPTMLYQNYYGMYGDGYLAPEHDAYGNWIMPDYQNTDLNGTIIEPNMRTNAMFILNDDFTTGLFNPYFDVSVEHWGWDGGGNNWYIYDEEMIDAAWRMMRASSDEDYLFAWQQYQLRFNQLLPVIPLYSEIYYQFINKNLQDYTTTSEWEWTDAIYYAWIGK